MGKHCHFTARFNPSSPESLCSPCVDVDLLPVFWFPPRDQKHAATLITDRQLLMTVFIMKRVS